MNHNHPAKGILSDSNSASDALILKGGAAERINEKTVGMERRKRGLEQFVAESVQPPPLLHPEMANFYRKQVTELYEAFQEDSDTQHISAAEMLRSLIKEIIITPENGELSIDVRGDLAGILGISQKTKNPAKLTGLSQVKMVAGACNYLNLRFGATTPSLVYKCFAQITPRLLSTLA